MFGSYATMTAMPPPHSSETKQRRRAPASSSLGDDAPAAGLDLDHEALEAGRVVVDPAPEARLVRLHRVRRGREARHLCCGSMEAIEARRASVA